MTPRQKLLVQATFEKAELNADLVGELFYRQLFNLDPGLKALFKTDIDEQGRCLMRMIAMMVKALDYPDEFQRLVGELGRRHAGYGVGGRQYETVGKAFLWALEAGIGGQFTPEVREAWTAFYDGLADSMQRERAAEAGQIVLRL